MNGTVWVVQRRFGMRRDCPWNYEYSAHIGRRQALYYVSVLQREQPRYDWRAVKYRPTVETPHE